MNRRIYSQLIVAVGLVIVAILVLAREHLQVRKALGLSRRLDASLQDINTEPRMDSELPSVIPVSLLNSLNTKFSDIRPEMHEEEVLSTLGLNRFRHYLDNNYRFQMDGAGGNHKTYALDETGFKLEFYDFLGHDPKCFLHTPDEQKIATAPIGQRVFSMAGFDNYLNPGQ